MNHFFILYKDYISFKKRPINAIIKVMISKGELHEKNLYTTNYFYFNFC